MVSFNSVKLHQDEEGKIILDLEITIKKDTHPIVMMFNIPSTEDILSPVLNQLPSVNLEMKK